MSQIQISEDDCGNRHFYKCEIVDSFCKNCGRSYVKKGDFVKGECDECGKKTTIVIDTVYTSGEFRGDCQQCTEDSDAIHELYQDFVWACEMDHDEDYHAIEERALGKIVKLPERQLKMFLRHMNRGIER